MVEKRLRELGLEIPPAPKPVAVYVPAVQSGRILFVSGQLPLKEGRLLLTGPVGNGGASVQDAQAAMRQCFLNALAAATTCVPVSGILRVLRLGAFVLSTPGFSEQHLVANGASDLALELFGDSGKHARAAVGVSALPLNAAVELEVAFEVTA